MAELNIKITVPDDKAQEILNDFVTFHGYQAQVENEEGELVDNPLTRVQYMKRQIIRYLRDSVKTHRARKAAGEATNIDAVEMS